MNCVLNRANIGSQKTIEQAFVVKFILTFFYVKYSDL